MRKILYRLLVILFLFIGLLPRATAQKKVTKDYKNNPEWIKMMDDPNVNFYEAVKAFDMYWQGREKPVQEKEVFENYNEKKITTIRETHREAKQYAIEYKKFQNWKRESLPYVQPDGRILSMEERLKLFEKEKKERSTGPDGI